VAFIEIEIGSHALGEVMVAGSSGGLHGFALPRHGLLVLAHLG
jgi:hypothetical protein